MPRRSFWPRRVGTAAGVGRLFSLYLAFAVLKHTVPLGALARLAWRDPAGGRDQDAERRTLAHLTKIRKVLRVPDRDCLQQSLLLFRELSRAGVDPVLVVGFRTAPAGLVGHAWVQAEDRIIANPLSDTAPFVPVCSFGRGGRLLSGSLTPRTA